MNRKNFMIPIFIAAAIVFIIGVCLNIYLEFDNSLRSSVEQFDSDSEFVEEQSKQTSEGYLTVFDHAGVTHFQYEGEIIIENDGSNGQPINIQIYIPNEDPSYQLKEQIYE